jgi:hypothetical protein
MANIRRKDFVAGGASDFEIISDNTVFYIFLALLLVGIAAIIF